MNLLQEAIDVLLVRTARVNIRGEDPMRLLTQVIETVSGLRQIIKKPTCESGLTESESYHLPSGLKNRPSLWGRVFSSALFMNFYENERKREFPNYAAFANAEQDWWMPLILQ
jgi:hypothetical protein